MNDLKLIFFTCQNNRLSECFFNIFLNGSLIYSGKTNKQGEALFSREKIIGEKIKIHFWKDEKMKNSPFKTNEFLWGKEVSVKLIREPVTKKILMEQAISNEEFGKGEYIQSYYVVQNGDTYDILEEKFSPNFIPMLFINNLPLDYKPKIGDILLLPIKSENKKDPQLKQERNKSKNLPIAVIESNIATRTPWIDIAKQELGVKEIPKRTANNLRIIEYHSTTGKFSDDETLWCSSFVNWVIGKAGIKGTNSARALSWKDWGIILDKPAYGSIGVIKWPKGGHVGFVVGIKRDKNGKEKIILLGGNQSDKVQYSEFAKHLFVAFVYPSNYMPLYEIPEWNESSLDNSGRTR
ncbi:TIGR02594 family protein [Aggregatibacter actinomycetemcomitans]|uniref:NlpC/P60 family protein n=1 Tax=Aggregatibacter actinomycetemcomitans TaxID=714 RepID=UPI00197BE4F9|nr:TIGR02594 family protein [Aggregatibacter actinomycetemcomitans]MBN6062747.1 TIGR02594 family protein [Aggregatibacter actinomycetemcomitans]MBN6083975.1 TIGR02594 family protein [Aggregatibacter actinomycetemcomitans]